VQPPAAAPPAAEMSRCGLPRDAGKGSSRGETRGWYNSAGGRPIGVGDAPVADGWFAAKIDAVQAELGGAADRVQCRAMLCAQGWQVAEAVRAGTAVLST
jgi:hypothetical protein